MGVSRGITRLFCAYINNKHYNFSKEALSALRDVQCAAQCTSNPPTIAQHRIEDREEPEKGFAFFKRASLVPVLVVQLLGRVGIHANAGCLLAPRLSTAKLALFLDTLLILLLPLQLLPRMHDVAFNGVHRPFKG